jgi:uncharacterized membrane protein
VIYPAAFWPGILGISILLVGVFTYRRDFQSSSRDGAFGLTALGPVFVAASIAAFAGEHFSAGPALAALVPKWLPAPLFIAYFVGVAHLAAAVSFVARRYIRWSALGLAVMFALFVLFMDLPAALKRPEVRIFWSLVARQATFSIGALALFAIATRNDNPRRAAAITMIARIWTAAVLIFYGIENALFPRFAPGVPSMVATQAWVPQPALIAYATGLLFIGFGFAMLFRKIASGAAARCGLFVTLLTALLYVPQWVMAPDLSRQITGINFVFDTLLFAGTVLVIARAISETGAAHTANTTTQ